MAREIVCISPVDGREYLRRPVASEAEIAAALARAKAAQREWRRVPVEARAAIVSQVVGALKAMGPEIAEELAWQMGRPIRYGQGEMWGVEERTLHMARIAPTALAPVVPEARAGFERWVSREPLGIVFTVAPAAMMRWSNVRLFFSPLFSTSIEVGLVRVPQPSISVILFFFMR